MRRTARQIAGAENSQQSPTPTPTALRGEELGRKVEALANRVLGPEPFRPPVGPCRYCGVSDAGPGWENGWGRCPVCRSEHNRLDSRAFVALRLIGVEPEVVADPWVRSKLADEVIDFASLRWTSPNKGQAEPWAHVDRARLRARLDELLDIVARATWTCGACGIRRVSDSPPGRLARGGSLCGSCVTAQNLDEGERKRWAAARLAGLRGVPAWSGDEMPVVPLWYETKSTQANRDPWGHVPPEVKRACQEWAFANFPPHRFKAGMAKRHPAVAGGAALPPNQKQRTGRVRSDGRAKVC